MSGLQPFTLPKIEMICGTTQELVFVGVFDLTQYPFYFIGCTAEFAISQFHHRGAAPIIVRTMNVIADGKGNQNNALSVKLSPNDTIDLTPGRYAYQITIKDSYGNYEASQGYLDLFTNIDGAYSRS